MIDDYMMIVLCRDVDLFAGSRVANPGLISIRLMGISRQQIQGIIRHSSESGIRVCRQVAVGVIGVAPGAAVAGIAHIHRPGRCGQGQDIPMKVVCVCTAVCTIAVLCVPVYGICEARKPVIREFILACYAVIPTGPVHTADIATPLDGILALGVPFPLLRCVAG